MIRVSIGPRVGGALYVPPVLVAASAGMLASSAETGLAAAMAASVLLMCLESTSSLRQRTGFCVVSFVFIVVALRAVIASGDRLRMSVVVMVAVAGAFTMWIQRRSAGGAVRSEELVGWTVADAERVLGYPKGLQPAGMATPTLVAVPEGAAPSDLGDPAVRADLVVTAVALDPAIPSITFGVAPPHTVRRRDVTREEMQAELVARVGGYPGSLRPERRVLGAPTPG
ncbi:hypothetical protein FK268_22140 [Tsukamurella sputi]|uniref:Uncharacterized protein n=1 Tax=Tsukamurella sputi TaxID=2591848 RepID=A0A5C5RHN3_9ACTN|nr:hypothetical protein [Tsukamurella sputi]TWS21893.1 hypothetical protein FK268_22140 [Tsukamurella sputi]